MVTSEKLKELWNKPGYRKHMKEIHIGQVPWNKGIPCREETKEKISQSKKGQTPWLGRKHTKESRKKMSKSHFKGEHLNKEGYLELWNGTRYVPMHHKVFCEHHNMEKIPDGFIVHHIDQNKQNNSITNLQMMSISNHVRLHNVSKV
jgi:hypothetical protein